MANPRGNPQNLKPPFKRGESPNPGGKPVGARNALSAEFLKKLAKDFKENGQAAITAMRKEHPDRYVAVIASLVPKENDVNVNIKRDAREYTDAELAAIIANEIGSRSRADEPSAGEGESSSVH